MVPKQVVVAQVHVFKSEGELRQYAYNHKGDTSDVPDVLVYNKVPYKFIDDLGLHSIPKAVGRLIAKQLYLDQYGEKSYTNANIMYVNIQKDVDGINQIMVAKYTFQR